MNHAKVRVSSRKHRLEIKREADALEDFEASLKQNEGGTDMKKEAAMEVVKGFAMLLIAKLQMLGLYASAFAKLYYYGLTYLLTDRLLVWANRAREAVVNYFSTPVEPTEA